MRADTGVAGKRRSRNRCSPRRLATVLTVILVLAGSAGTGAGVSMLAAPAVAGTGVDAQRSGVHAERAGAHAREPGGDKRLFLTFDDGPDPKWTPKVLAVLERHRAAATFFQVGTERSEHPDAAQAVSNAGQAIGDHTSTHADLTTLDRAGIRTEIRGGPSSDCLRPPYGAVDSDVRHVAEEYGLRIALWHVDTEDWSRPGVAEIEKAIVEQAKDGRVILMHDGGGDRAQTVRALDRALNTLEESGWTSHALDCAAG